MSDQLPFTGGGVVLAATGVSQGLWWLTAIAVAVVVAGAVLARIGRRRAVRATAGHYPGSDA